MTDESTFKLTYSTMFNPPEILHTRFSEAVSSLKTRLGKEHGMFIDGKEVFATEKFEDRTPIDTSQVLGIFQKGTAEHAEMAIAAARKAFPGWKKTPWEKRIEYIRKAADLMDQRIFDMGAVMAMEVGKIRMESLGDVAETADLLRYACEQMEKNAGYTVAMKQDPLVGFTSTNTSVLKPYGVWLVISPFNFPGALTGGPTAAALVAGNTVVFKPATDTPWIPRMIAECLRDAGVPEGVFNYVTGPGSSLGQALIDNPDVNGVTFTGSLDVGMRIYRDFAKGTWVRPVILELGGKNPAIVSKHANLDDAALGIMRSSFGLQGQKCSACSRVFVEEEVYDGLMERLVALVSKIKIGDPLERDVYMGPVINKGAYQDFQKFCEEVSQAGGKFLTGGKILTDGDYAKGYFCTPTIVANLPETHHLWKQEMFVPIVTVAAVKNLDEAMRRANDVDYGLTAGFYGTLEEVEWFFDNIEAGVVYANRPQGVTTGAWPGYQPFGGWKGSGSSGKNSGGVYYLPLYLHEQIHTHVRR
jgi:1-pyrroline-5-carboxylate dehydrogenase